MEFDRTESSYVENKIEEENLRMQIGRVVKVFEHTQPNDNSNFEANVILRDEDKERREVPIMVPRKGEIAPPQKDDKVIVGFLDSAGEAPIIVGNLYDAATRAPLGRAGMYRLRRGSLYLEAHEDGDWMRIAHKSADDGTPNAKVEIDSNGTVSIEGNASVNTDPIQTDNTLDSSDSLTIASGRDTVVGDYTVDGDLTVDGTFTATIGLSGSGSISGDGHVRVL